MSNETNRGRSFSIDLVICTYNNAVLLENTLESIAGLQVPPHINWSVLVVDNNCTDHTGDIVTACIKKNLFSLTMITEPKQGLTNARLCGVRNSNAEWIAFIDDDCLLAPDWIEEAGTFIASHPSCGLFGSRIQLIWEKTPPSFVTQFPFAFAGKNHGDIAKKVKAVAGAGMVIKRAILEQSGWTKEPLLADRIGNNLVSGGDMEIAIRVGALCEVWYNPDCKLQHIIPERRTTKKYLQRMLFGLGASRHNVAALTWRGSYLSWFLYTCVYSIGMLGLCLTNYMNHKQRSAGLKTLVSPYFGWNAAMFSMLKQNKQRREAIIGCIKKQTLINQ